MEIKYNNKNGEIKCQDCKHRNEWVHGGHELWTTCKGRSDGTIITMTSWCEAGEKREESTKAL